MEFLKNVICNSLEDALVGVDGRADGWENG